jgi:phosphate starvation-inducible protein PhoH and related proteins
MPKKPTPKNSEDLNIKPKLSEKINFKSRSFKFSEKQKQFLDLALDDSSKIVFLAGPSGTSKTYMSVYASLNLLAKDLNREIIYVRSIAESAEKGLGSLPGEAGHKFEPFVTPLWEKIDEMVSPEHAVWLKQSQNLSAKPINYLRGVNWPDKLIVADEAQNFSFKELVTLITRIGENSKMFICGDFMQADVKSSGFQQMFDLFNDEESKSNGIHCFQFDNNDIHRSGILRFIISKLQKGK